MHHDNLLADARRGSTSTVASDPHPVLLHCRSIGIVFAVIGTDVVTSIKDEIECTSATDKSKRTMLPC